MVFRFTSPPNCSRLQTLSRTSPTKTTAAGWAGILAMAEATRATGPRQKFESTDKTEEGVAPILRSPKIAGRRLDCATGVSQTSVGTNRANSIPICIAGLRPKLASIRFGRNANSP